VPRISGNTTVELILVNRGNGSGSESSSPQNSRGSFLSCCSCRNGGYYGGGGTPFQVDINIDSVVAPTPRRTTLNVPLNDLRYDY